MNEYIFGEFHIRGEEHRHVDDSMETGDVFSDNVQVGWVVSVKFLAVGGVSDTRKVVREGITPYIHDLCIVVWNRNPPRHLVDTSREADIIEPLREK